MKIFLSALENNNARLDELGSMHYNLMSYYYIPKNPKRALGIIEQSERIMIDSGAHTFQKGKTKLNWEEYTESYARFIRENDCEKIVGYFEMDVDKVIGLERVIKLRRRLEQETDKIIPVWHKGRGIENFYRMCEEYSGKVVPTILFGTVFNGIVVGAELSIVYGSPFLLNAVCVAAGEGISLLLGAVLYKLVGKRVESIWR